MLSVRNISHSYGHIQALKGINFEVGQETIFGLIGPDGAGKSTLIRILATLLLPQEGEASVLGKDVIDSYSFIRKNIGYMPGRFSLYEDLSVEENLSLFAAIHGTTIEENYELIKDIYQQIEPFKTRRAGQLSGGMKQKLALSCAMIHAPRLILLDEPTTGVDPVSRKEFWQMLLKLKERGVTILVSTPYMDEAALCDKVALIYEGEFLDIDTPDALLEKFQGLLYRVPQWKEEGILQQLRPLPSVQMAYLNGGYFHIQARNKHVESDFNSLFPGKGKLEEVEPNIEDCFLQLMSAP